MKEIFPGSPEKEDVAAKNQTTLIVDEVPSDLAYGIFMESLSNGVTLTQQELSQEVSRRMDGDKLTVHFAELEGMFTDLLNNQVLITNDRPSLRVSEEEKRLNALLSEMETPEEKEEFHPQTNDHDEVREEKVPNDYIKSIIEGVKDELRTKYRQSEKRVFEDIPSPNPLAREQEEEVFMEHLLR